MKLGTALVLALAIFAPVCLCSLHSAPKQPAEHSCCAQESQTPGQPEKGGCDKGCSHCNAEFKVQQDQPKETQPVFSQILLGVPAYAASEYQVPEFLAFVSPIHFGSPAPPGRTPTYLLHCSLLC